MAVIKKGDRISLARSPFFFLNEAKINLRRGIEETALIPDSVDDKVLGKISRSVFIGDIKLGWPKEKVTPIPDDESIGKILEKGRNKVNDFLYELSQSKSLKDESKIEKFEKLLELEKSNKNRKTVTETLEKYLSGLAGVSPVKEEEKEKVEISITKEGKTE